VSHVTALTVTGRRCKGTSTCSEGRGKVYPLLKKKEDVRPFCKKSSGEKGPLRRSFRDGEEKMEGREKKKKRSPFSYRERRWRNREVKRNKKKGEESRIS